MRHALRGEQTDLVDVIAYDSSSTDDETIASAQPSPHRRFPPLRPTRLGRNSHRLRCGMQFWLTQTLRLLANLFQSPAFPFWFSADGVCLGARTRGGSEDLFGSPHEPHSRPIRAGVGIVFQRNVPTASTSTESPHGKFRAAAPLWSAPGNRTAPTSPMTCRSMNTPNAGDSSTNSVSDGIERSEAGESVYPLSDLARRREQHPFQPRIAF
jgi:hypothetical protein